MPSIKNIAVTPNKRGGGRKRPSPTVEVSDDEFSVSATMARPVRRVVPRPTHRYHVGEQLRMAGGGYSVARSAAGCKIIALLPYEGSGSLLYRVRSDGETFERVVAEADLTR